MGRPSSGVGALMAFPTGQYWVCGGNAVLVPNSGGLAACPAGNVTDFGSVLNTLQVASSSDVLASSSSIDYSTLAELWGFSFTTVLMFWLISHVSRQVIASFSTKDE